MSYNIDSAQVVSNKNARMRVADIRMLLAVITTPESCFLKKLAKKYTEETNKDEEIPVDSFEWCGTWSGKSFDVLEKQVAPLIKGYLEVVFVWEGGDDTSALVIENGKVKNADVGYKLTLKE